MQTKSEKKKIVLSRAVDPHRICCDRRHSGHRSGGKGVRPVPHRLGIWLNLLFVLLVPLIFFSIASSIASIADTKRVGKLLALTIGIFVVTAAIAGIYMFIVTGIFGVDTSIQLDTSEVAAAAAADSVGDQIVNTFTVSDFPLVISRSHILALIVFTVFFGVTVSLLGEQGKPVVSWLNSMSLVFYKNGRAADEAGPHWPDGVLLPI